MIYQISSLGLYLLTFVFGSHLIVYIIDFRKKIYIFKINDYTVSFNEILIN